MRKRKYPPGIGRDERSPHKSRHCFFVRFKMAGSKTRYFKALEPEATLEDAKDLLAKMRADVSRGLGNPMARQGTYTLKDMLALIDIDHVRQARAAGTIRAFKSKAKQLLAAFGEGALVREDRYEEWNVEIQTFEAKRLATGEKRATLNGTLSWLKRGFILAREAGWITRVPKIMIPDPQNERGRVLSPEEEPRLLATLPEHFKPVFQIGLQTGWRIASELMPRVWSDYDHRTGTLTLPPSRANRSHKNKKARVCKLSRRAVEILDRLRAARKVVALDAGQELIFKTVGRSQSSELFRDAVKRAKLTWHKDDPERVTLHVTRGTFIRRCRDAGIPVEIVCSYTGHTPNSPMILRYYGRVSVGAQQIVTDALDRMAAG
jgi:integrase